MSAISGDFAIRTYSPPPSTRRFVSLPANSSSWRCTTLLLFLFIAVVAAVQGFFYGNMCTPRDSHCLVKKSSPSLERAPPITNAELVTRFERLQDFGSGGQSRVVLVKDKKTGRGYVLKSNSNDINFQQRANVISYLLDNGVTYHIARLHEVYRNPKSYYEPCKANHFSLPPNFFIDTNSTMQPNDFGLRNILIMDIFGRGRARFSREERLALELQDIHTEEQLQRHGIVVLIPDRDKLFRQLTDRECFGGYQLNKYERLKYRIRGDDYYVPSKRSLRNLLYVEKLVIFLYIFRICLQIRFVWTT